MDLRNKGLNGTDASHALDEAGITVNKNGIPFDSGSPVKPSGIRIGTPAVTTRGIELRLKNQIPICGPRITTSGNSSAAGAGSWCRRRR